MASDHPSHSDIDLWARRRLRRIPVDRLFATSLILSFLTLIALTVWVVRQPAEPHDLSVAELPERWIKVADLPPEEPPAGNCAAGTEPGAGLSTCGTATLNAAARKAAVVEGVKKVGLLKLLGSVGSETGSLEDALGGLSAARDITSALAGAGGLGTGRASEVPLGGEGVGEVHGAGGLGSRAGEVAYPSITGRAVAAGSSRLIDSSNPSQPALLGELANHGDAHALSERTALADRQAQPNPWILTSQDRLSTFAADVDTASYTLARRFLKAGARPTPHTVRPEEFVNHFRYRYPGPREGTFTVHADLAPSPFAAGRHLLRLGVQGRRVEKHERKRVNLTFLVDVSGSMSGPDRLPLVKKSLEILLSNLRDDDSVALVTYAGETRQVLPMTSARERRRIVAAISSLTEGGGTAMGSGVELAYRNAVHALRPGEVSRVLVLSDGDANIGSASHDEILRKIEGHVKEGVTLSTIGFGMGNYRDDLMEQLADKGNGNNYYVDSLRQARRIFEDQLAGTLEVLAKDVKLQVEFEPAAVTRYRLVGYENRDVADRDFRNDRADGGEIGAGHSVTALYELELGTSREGSIATVRIRAKAPNGERADESEFPVTGRSLQARFEGAPASFRLAAIAAAFAEGLREKGRVSLEAVRAMAAELPMTEPDVTELVELIDRAIAIDRRPGQVSTRHRGEYEGLDD